MPRHLTKTLITTLFLVIVIGFFVSIPLSHAQVVGAVYSGSSVQAIKHPDCEFIPGSGIPGPWPLKCDPTLLAQFMVALINFFMRLAIVATVLMITVGGFQWLMAMGNSSKISNAKETIFQSILGLILALTAVVLFNQIDTSFTEFKTDTFKIEGNLNTSCFTPLATMQYYLDIHQAQDLQSASKMAHDYCEGPELKANGLKCQWLPGTPINAAQQSASGLCVPRGVDCSVITVCSKYYFEDDCTKDPCKVWGQSVASKCGWLQGACIAVPNE